LWAGLIAESLSFVILELGTLPPNVGGLGLIPFGMRKREDEFALGRGFACAE